MRHDGYEANWGQTLIEFLQVLILANFQKTKATLYFQI